MCRKEVDHMFFFLFFKHCHHSESQEEAGRYGASVKPAQGRSSFTLFCFTMHSLVLLLLSLLTFFVVAVDHHQHRFLLLVLTFRVDLARNMKGGRGWGGSASLLLPLRFVVGVFDFGIVILAHQLEFRDERGVCLRQ